MNGISIIICCYNSAERLPETIKHLARQKVETNINWEIIIVNNASKDNTKLSAFREWEKYNKNTPFFIIDEMTPGLSFAREAGIKQAKYDLVIFCDDDNWLEENYVQTAYRLIKEDPGIGIVGGLNTALADIKFPEWFKDFEQSYACGPQAAQDGEIAKDRFYIFGAGMVIRKEIFNRLKSIGFKSQLSDRKGKELSSGGDTEICILTALLGYKLVYSSKLRLYHYINSARLQWPYLIKLMRGHQQSSYKLSYFYALYLGHSFEKSWWKKLINLSLPFKGKHGVLSLYHYFLCNQKVGDSNSVSMMLEMERWLAHISLMPDYTEFVAYLDTIKKNINSPSPNKES